ncbi:MAG: CRISPR-associated endonuclease Cas1, partial [Betaproteobacteria bacterium]
NDAAVRLAQARAVMDDAFCRAWALDLVRAKLLRQQRTLGHMQAQRPDARKPLFDAVQTLAPILAELGATGAPNPTLQSLRGREGAAARAYFAGLAGVMPPALGFAGRNRRPPKDPVNVCLSLGYTLLHMQAVQSCTVAGLDPLLGFYHRPAIGRESLASDLIEPLRPALDEWVWELLRARSLREEHFTIDKGACLLGKAGREIFYAGWEKQSAPWRRWLRKRTRQLAAHLRADGLPWLQQDEDDEPC